MCAAEPLPENWLLSTGLRSVVDGTPMPRLAYALLLRVETFGSVYMKNDFSLDLYEAMGQVLGICEQRGFACLQETAFLYAPITPSNLGAASGFLIVNKDAVLFTDERQDDDGQKAQRA